MEEQTSDSLTAEEIRQRRLAYFQSQTGLEKAVEGNQADTKKKQPTVPEKHFDNSKGKRPTVPEKQFDDSKGKRPTVSEKTIIHRKVPTQELSKRPEEMTRIDIIKETVPNLKLELDDKKISRNEDGYNEKVEKLIQMTKKEMAEKYSTSSSRESTPKQSSSKTDSQPAQLHQSNVIDFREYRPQQSNDLHIENIFSDRNSSSRVRQSTKTLASVKDSHDNGAYSYFLKSVDADQVEELGLSTHRPEDGPGSKERSPRALDESMSEDLKYALGERKYKEFLEKSMKDIDALYGDNFKNKTNVDKLEKGGTKDINLRREQYDNVTSTLMSKKINEKEQKANNETNKKWEEPITEGNRPLLNRPKYEPSSIYQNKRETEVEENNASRYNRSKSVDEPHILSSRNFAFSADEIYSQAYQPHMIKSTPIQISGSDGIGHGHPMYHGPISNLARPGHVGYSQPFPHEFPSHPAFFHSHSYDGSTPPSQGPYYSPDYMVPQSSSGYFVSAPYGNQGTYPIRTPRQVPHSPTSRREHGHPLMQHSYSHFEDAHGRPISARSVHKMDQQDMYRFKQQHPQMFPHPPEEHGYDQEMKPHLPGDKMGNNPPYYNPEMFPHPPESQPGPGPHGDMAAFQDYLHMMPKGIPYPPPPNDIELQAYFQFLGSQGYPIPYHTVVPPDSPREDQGKYYHIYVRLKSI